MDIKPSNIGPFMNRLMVQKEAINTKIVEANLEQIQMLFNFMLDETRRAISAPNRAEFEPVGLAMNKTIHNVI